MIMPNKVYDALKWITLVFLPALAVAYLGLSGSWNLPYPTEVVATIAIIDTFLATLLGVSTSNYKVRAARLNFSLTESFGTPAHGWFMSKNWYDVMTWVAQLLLPALASFYFALAGTWGLPYPDQVVSTIVALDAFLGAILGFSTSQFHKQVAIECAADVPAGLSKTIN